MAKPKFYKVNTLPKQTSSGSIFSKIGKNKRRHSLIASVIGVYMLVGSMVGFILFNTSSGPAKANESAFITSSIRLMEEKQYKLGDEVKLSLTLQNTSITEPINSVMIEMFSTQNSLTWNNISSQSRPENSIPVTNLNSFRLPILSSGERAEYVISSTLEDNQVDYLNIIGKIRYLNRDGAQDTETNRVFTKLNPVENPSSGLLEMSVNKTTFNVGELPKFIVKKTFSQEISGKVYIVNTNGQDVVSSLDCNLDKAEMCEITASNLANGTYTALFIDEKESVFSNIASFSVGGKKADFVPSAQSTLEVGFNNISINGVVPVVAKRVISLNQVQSSDNLCGFEVISGGVVVETVRASVDIDRSCRAVLNSDVFKKGDGLYTIKLAGTGLARDISYQNKAGNLLNLTLVNPPVEKGKSINVSLADILDSEGLPVNGKKATLGIWHPSSGTYQEFNNFSGENLAINNGVFSTQIPSSNLDLGGLYLVVVKLETGQQTDWLSLNFEDKQIAFSGSGVLFKSTALRAGEATSLSLENITDRSGNLVSDAECSANLYSSIATNNLTQAKGQIKQGICTVNLAANQITKAGPLLVSFTGEKIDNPISQSKQVQVLANRATDYGDLNLEFLPARAGFANNIIIGPVVDAFKNPANSFSLKLQAWRDDQLVDEFTNLKVEDGFAKLVIPSSIFSGDLLTFKLVDENNIVLNSTDFVISESSEPLLVPNFPASVNSDKPIIVGINNLAVDNASECSLKWVKSKTEFSEQKVEYNSESGSCNFEWSLNQFRSTPISLVEFTVGDYKFTNIVKNESGEAANIFIITPEIYKTPTSELNISLLTSPILDKQGIPVTSGSLKWQYNGRVSQLPIENGFSRLSLLANQLESKDIQNNKNFRTLDIDLDVKAGVGSISKTNNISVYLGSLDISNQAPTLTLLSGANQLGQTQSQIFQFKTDICNLKAISSNQTITPVKTHWQAGTCYVQADPKPGKNTLIFEEKGFNIGSFEYTTGTQNTDIVWCSEQSEKCLIQVLAGINSPITAVILDGDKEFKFVSENLDNTLTLSQNGLNPLKKYTVVISYKDSNNQPVEATRQLLGEQLL